ncbi:MAG: helix-turn-helix domain-containing protein [Prevotella sp.]
MESSMQTIEAFAHYIRGAITLFFIFWCFKLYVYKRRNRMMKLLYYATLFLAFGFLKDAVFLFADWKNSILLNDVARTIDMLFIPLICSFFLEAVRPGLVTNKKLAVALGVQSMFLAFFMVTLDEIAIFCALVLDFIISLITMIYVVIFSIKYRNFISSNYSYRENIDVNWVVVSCIVYFSTLFFFIFAFDQTTWLSESMYNLFSLVLWTFLYLYARRHRVIRIIKPKLKQPVVVNEESKEPEIEEEQPQSYRDDIITERLTRVMEVNKVYLNPKVSLGEVALAIGSNKTYLSDYLNNSLHTTFYDYINTYRIAEACRIIDAMPTEGRRPMSAVAEISGFNSLSTFNRYFLKVKGMSPKSYYSSKQIM